MLFFLHNKKMNNKISIVMSHFDRCQQMYNTFVSIFLTSIPKDDFEIIVVDDASSDINEVYNTIKQFDDKLNINLIEIKSEEKKWTNPCIPFNRGFEKINNDIVIIQNPECLHVKDILSNTISEINETNYLSYSCYSVAQATTDKITEAIKNNDLDFVKVLSPIQNKRGSTYDGWYNHPVLRPCGYHFCSAITKNNLDKLGGFDERYAKGYAFDDDEFLFRIKLLRLNIKIVSPDTAFCIHQYHRTLINSRKMKLWTKNRDIFHRITRKLTIKNLNAKGK